jgi:hypothetical protein
MAISIVVSVLMVGSVSASAVTATAIKDVPTYKSRTAYIDSVRKGTTQASDSFVDTFEKVYSFTLKDNANFMLNFGFTNHTQYNWDETYLVEVYTDPNLLYKKDLNVIKNDNNNEAMYGFLGKGTYYVKAYYENKKATKVSNNFFMSLGQVNKNTKFTTVSYVRTNSNKTVTYRLNTIDDPQTVYVHTCNYGRTTGTTTRVCGSTVTLNAKKEFNYTYKNQDPNAHMSIWVKDVNGYESETYALCLNKYTATVVGVKNKDYTGKNVGQSGLSVKAGYDAASYRLSYRNNKNVGTATVYINGSGTTIGSVAKTFRIVPSKITKATSKVKGSKATLSWSKSKGAKRYVLQKNVKGKWKNVKTLSSTSYKLTVSKGKTTFRVYGTATVSKKAYNGYGKTFTVNRKK